MKHYLENSATLADMQLPPIYNPSTVPSSPSGDIVIEKGESFTVNSTLEMLPGASITVEPGGSLEVYSTITGACGQMWQGIIVIGKPSAPDGHDDLSEHGYVWVHSTGKIEHARCGIAVHGADYDGTVLTGKGGGYVKVTGGTFENNQMGVRYGEYHRPNKGHFWGADFTITDNYRGEASPVFVELNAVQGLWFFYCSFQNLSTDCSSKESLPIGINSLEAGYKVEACNFEDLYIGIKGFELEEFGSFNITGCSFSGCYTGIDATKCENFRITGSDFSIKKPSECASSANDVIGIKLQSNTPGFRLMKNDFFYDGMGDPDETLIGIQCSGLGSGMDNMITRNTFTDLDIGNRASGNNGNLQDGLIYTCNTNVSNPDDFIVTTGGTIRKVQQDFDNINDLLPTGNIFSEELNSFFNNGPTSITYHYYDSGSAQDPISAGFWQGITAEEVNIPNGNCSDPPPCEDCPPDSWNDNFFNYQTDYFTRKDNLQYLTDTNQIAAELDTIHTLRRLMDRNASLILQHYSLDTLSFNLDSILTWLTRVNTLPSDLRLASHYFFTGNLEEFDTLWAEIPVKHELQDYQEGELDELGLVYSLMRPQVENGDPLDRLPQATIDSLMFWKSWCSEPGFLAHSLLWRNGLETEPDCSAGMGSRSDDTEKITKIKADRLIIFPNPTTGQITIVIPSKTIEGELLIHTLQGFIVRKEMVNGLINQVQFSTEDLAAGVYIITFKETNNGVLYHEKLIIGK